jgi:tetratricopeptide (TPR) repeat protein
MNRTVNIRALLILGLGIPAFFVCVHFLHAFQVGRGASDFLEQADRAAAAGRSEEEQKFLRDYLGLRPDDAKMQARYGHSLKESVHSREEARKAYQALARAVQLDHSLSEVRREAATMAVESGLFIEAREHAQALKQEFPDDGEADCLLGRCAEATRQYDEAIKYYQAAEKHAPAQELAFIRHAIVLRDRKKTATEADEIVRRLSEKNPASIAARLAAGRYFVRYGLWADADRELAFVTGSPGADAADVYLMAAGVDDALGRAAPARERVKEGLHKHPGDALLSLAGARLDIRAGRPDDARKALHAVTEAENATPQQLASAGELYLDLDDVDAARAVAERLSAKKGPNAARIDARLHIRKGEFGEARVILERLRTENLPPSDARQVEVLLGSCYERLNDPEAALAAYRRALRFDPNWSPACRGELSALLSLGNLDEAELAYRRLAATDANMNLGLAQLLLARQLRRPAKERQWKGVEAALASLPEATAHSVDAEKVRADLFAATGKSDDARQLLEKERKQDPLKVRPWLALARFSAQQGDLKGSREILREAEKKRGPDAALTLAQIELALREEPAAARKELAALEQTLDTFVGIDQLRVLRGLAEAYYRRGDPKKGIALWEQAAERAPQDLEVHLRLLEMAYRSGDAPAMEKQTEAIRNLEGTGGGLAAWGEAARRLVLAEKGDKSQLPEVHRRLDEARARRPRWAPVALLDARLAVLEGDFDRASDQYVQAVRLGEREPDIIRAAVDGLYRRRRYSQARDLLQECAEQTLSTPDLGRRAAELTLLQAGTEGPGKRQALEQARQAIPTDSKDPRDYQWLAQVARAADEPAEAEKMLRKALSLSDKSPGTWLALIQLLSTLDLKKAEAALDEANGKLSAEEKPFVLAPAYEMIGQFDKARQQYESLLAQRPSDVVALQVVADFYSRRGPVPKAEAALRRLLDPAVKVNDFARSAARRELALLLVRTGTYAKFREALALLTDGVRQPTREDEIAHAVILATRPERRREARSLLEKLAKEGPLSAETQFILVQLMEADGDLARADDIILNLLGTDGRNPAIISYHLQSLLRRGQAQTAQPWVDALRSVEPDSIRTAALSARVAAKAGRLDEAVRQLLEYAKKHSERRISVASILEDSGALTDAERLLRETANGNRPEGKLALAEYLGRHKQVSEALAIANAARENCPPEIVAASSLAAARAGGANATELSALADRLEADSKKLPDSVALLQARAELEEIRGRFDEALALYQDVLRRNPEYVPSLNNRAWLLALKAVPGEEAIQLIDRVINREGPLANYLDTRAVAYLAAGQTAQAITDMEEAIRQDPAGPYYFHLADARLRSGDRSGAIAALREGKKHGLRPETVHALERDKCQQMLSELEVK